MYYNQEAPTRGDFLNQKTMVECPRLKYYDLRQIKPIQESTIKNTRQDFQEWIWMQIQVD